jgi:hypothetical protein
VHLFDFYDMLEMFPLDRKLAGNGRFFSLLNVKHKFLKK